MKLTPFIPPPPPPLVEICLHALMIRLQGHIQRSHHTHTHRGGGGPFSVEITVPLLIRWHPEETNARRVCSDNPTHVRVLGCYQSAQNIFVYIFYFCAFLFLYIYSIFVLFYFCTLLFLYLRCFCPFSGTGVCVCGGGVSTVLSRFHRKMSGHARPRAV